MKQHQSVVRVADARLFVDGNQAILLPDGQPIVDCCVTSPPYFRLRDYGVADQIGMETSLSDYVQQIVTVFREIRKVLKTTGSVWLNLGDSYSRGGGGTRAGFNERWHGKKSTRDKQSSAAAVLPKAVRQSRVNQLLGVPWRVAFALQDDGWVLRSRVVWQKPNPMPESVSNRPTRATEDLFLFTVRDSGYYYDPAPTRTPFVASTLRQLDAPYTGKAVKDYSGTGAQDPSETKRNILKRLAAAGGANARNVWTIASQPFTMTTPAGKSHFAVMPEELARRCVLTSCPPDGVVLDPFCGAGTTGVVAVKNGRRFVGFDLNRDFVELTERRISLLGVGCTR